MSWEYLISEWLSKKQSVVAISEIYAACIKIFFLKREENSNKSMLLATRILLWMPGPRRLCLRVYIDQEFLVYMLQRDTARAAGACSLVMRGRVNASNVLFKMEVGTSSSISAFFSRLELSSFCVTLPLVH